MPTIVLEAQLRKNLGKRASRRMRLLENKIPASLYGGNQPPQSIDLNQNKIRKALESESVYSSVLNLNIDGKVEHVILKSLQRHPCKSLILHMDLQRVSATDILIKLIPLHFINEQNSIGVKDGGIITHNMSQIEVRCQVKDLPEFITVDMSQVAVGDVIHLSNLQLPAGVSCAIDLTDERHDLPVASIHMPRVGPIEEAMPEKAAEVPTIGENAVPNE